MRVEKRISNRPEGTAYRGKRVLDIVLVIAILPIAIPLTAICVTLIAVTMGKPIFFQQRRPGLHGQSFTIWKFRTMRQDTDEVGRLLPDRERLTAIGRFLRRSSLDEVPELLNVVRGEMSFVGPRPLLPRYMPHFRSDERKRFDVLPGISGWAQVNGRNRLDWDKRLRCDVWYAENACLTLDMRILFLTFLHAVSGKDVEVAPETTMLDLDELRSQMRTAPRS